jgi:hypothetical protein
MGVGKRGWGWGEKIGSEKEKKNEKSVMYGNKNVCREGEGSRKCDKNKNEKTGVNANSPSTLRYCHGAGKGGELRIPKAGGEARGSSRPQLRAAPLATYSAHSNSLTLFWISSSFQKINKNILEAPGVYFLVSSGPSDPALSFPTIGKNVRGVPVAQGPLLEGWVGSGGEERGREEEAERSSHGSWTRSRGDRFKK